MRCVISFGYLVPATFDVNIDHDESDTHPKTPDTLDTLDVLSKDDDTSLQLEKERKDILSNKTDTSPVTETEKNDTMINKTITVYNVCRDQANQNMCECEFIWVRLMFGHVSNFPKSIYMYNSSIYDDCTNNKPFDTFLVSLTPGLIDWVSQKSRNNHLPLEAAMRFALEKYTRNGPLFVQVEYKEDPSYFSLSSGSTTDCTKPTTN